ncbi:MAG: ACT domain-containing protein, partial [Anaerotignaceae bacterium]
VAVRFSHCCNPVPGDEIIGFVTRGRGVSIHRTDCINIINLDEIERHRLIDAEWDVAVATDANVSFTAEIRLVCTDRNSLIMDISRVLSEENLLVKSFNGRSAKDGTAIFNLVLQINGKDHLDLLIRKFKAIKGVDEIERVSG